MRSSSGVDLASEALLVMQGFWPQMSTLAVQRHFMRVKLAVNIGLQSRGSLATVWQQKLSSGCRRRFNP